MGGITLSDAQFAYPRRMRITDIIQPVSCTDRSQLYRVWIYFYGDDFFSYAVS